MPTNLITYFSVIDIHVRPEGKDVEGCGKLKSPCFTMRYAIVSLNSNVILHVEGPRTFEFWSSPIEIKHNVTIRPFTSEFVYIQKCDNISGIFNITGNDFSKDLTTLSLEKFYVSDCPSNNLVIIANAMLIITNSTFRENGVLVKHNPNSHCDQIHLVITNSKFISNFLLQPWKAAISISACDSISIVAVNSQFNSTPISISSFHQVITFMNVYFDTHSEAAIFLHSLSSGQQNSVSFLNCSFIAVYKLRASPLLVLLDTEDSMQQSTVLIKNSIFVVNSIVSGAALNVGSTIEKPKHVNVKVILKDCLFNKCSTEGGGGAIFARNIKLLTINRCQFLNNSAADGGALYLKNVQTVQLTNSCFESNEAKFDTTYASRGGAIYSLMSGLSIVGCSFFDNMASFEGMSLHAEGCLDASIAFSTFLLHRTFDFNPRNAIIVMKSWMNSSISISKSVNISYNSPKEHSTSMNLILVEGKIKAKSIQGNCPFQHKLRNHSITSRASSFDYSLISLWCKRNKQTLRHFN